MKKIIAVLCFALAPQANALDENGCASAMRCLEVEGEFYYGQFTSMYDNFCGERVLIRSCNLRDDLDHDCESDVLENLEFWTNLTLKRANGNYRFAAVISKNAENDAKCKALVENWSGFEND